MAEQTMIHRKGVANQHFVAQQAVSVATTQSKVTDVFVLTGANGDLTLNAEALSDKHLCLATANNQGASIIPPTSWTVLGYLPDGTTLDVNGLTGASAGGWTALFLVDVPNTRLIVVGGANYTGIA